MFLLFVDSGIKKFTSTLYLLRWNGLKFSYFHHSQLRCIYGVLINLFLTLIAISTDHLGR